VQSVVSHKVGEVEPPCALTLQIASMQLRELQGDSANSPADVSNSAVVDFGNKTTLLESPEFKTRRYIAAI